MQKKLLVFVLAALILFGSGVVTGRLVFGRGPEPGATHVRPVRVPDVHGLTLGAAVAVLTSLGLKVEGQSLRARPDAYTPLGTVLSQGVSAGSQFEVGETEPHLGETFFRSKLASRALNPEYVGRYAVGAIPVALSGSYSWIRPPRASIRRTRGTSGELGHSRTPSGVRRSRPLAHISLANPDPRRISPSREISKD